MTVYLTSDVAPIGDQEPPSCRIVDAMPPIPIIDIGDYPARFQITLGNHRDPVAYLRGFAANLLALADEVEARMAVTA